MVAARAAGQGADAASVSGRAGSTSTSATGRAAGAGIGYQLIKAIEDMTGGEYAPSPGVVYPTLTMLEDMGLIREQKSKDSKKVFEATDEGRAHLDENSEEVDELIEKLEGHGSSRRSGSAPAIGRAVGNLMNALSHRISREGINEELMHEIASILDEAAQRIERVK